MPVREGAALYDESGNPVGHVTSGLFSPSLERPIAMAYVQTPVAKAQTSLLAEVRGKKLPVTVVSLPFVPHHYFR